MDSLETPATDLLSFAFEGPYEVHQHQPLYIDAEDPSRSLDARQFRKLVRSLIAGLRAAGLQRGESVLVNLANSKLLPHWT